MRGGRSISPPTSSWSSATCAIRTRFGGARRCRLGRSSRGARRRRAVDVRDRGVHVRQLARDGGAARGARRESGRKLVVASSMSIYGEGLYRAARPRSRAGGAHARAARAREWDYPGLEPVPTPETKRPGLTSIYALTKYDQERACLVAGEAYGIPTVALRLFNMYGPRRRCRTRIPACSRSSRRAS